MEQYKSLVASMMKMQFAAGMKTKNSKRGTIIASYIVLGALLAFFGVALGMSAPDYKSSGDMYGFVISVSLMVFAVTLIFGLIFLVGNLYFDKKASFYLALPVSQTKVFFSKLTVSYLFQLFFGILLFIPAIIVAGAMTGMGAQFYIFGIIGSVLLPFVSLLIAAVVSLPIAYLIGFLKTTPRLFMAIKVISYIVAFGAYFYFIIMIGGTTGSTDATEITAPGWMRTLALVIYPINSLAAAMTMTPIFEIGGVAAAFINIGLFLVVIIVAMAVCYFLTHALYFNAITKQFENVVEKKTSAVQKKIVAKENRSLISTLIHRDITSITSNGSMLFSTLLQILLSPLMAIIMMVSMYSFAASEGEATQGMHVLCAILMLFLFYNLNFASSTAFSRDAKVFNLYFTTPMDYKVYMKAKLIVHLVISLISAVLTSLIVGVVFFIFFDPIFLPFYILTAFSMAALSCVFGLWYNLKNPILNWTNMSELTHNSKPVLVPMMIFIAYGFVILLIALLTSIYIGGTLGLVILGLIFLLSAVIPLIVFSIILKNNALVLLDKFRD